MNDDGLDLTAHGAQHEALFAVGRHAVRRVRGIGSLAAGEHEPTCTYGQFRALPRQRGG